MGAPAGSADESADGSVLEAVAGVAFTDGRRW